MKSYLSNHPLLDDKDSKKTSGLLLKTRGKGAQSDKKGNTL
jgi:hypothetical protein